MFVAAHVGCEGAHAVGTFKTTGYVSIKFAVCRGWVGGFETNAFNKFNFSTLQ
jgi:hypothetical protein